MRGKGQLGVKMRSSWGITPAYAGKRIEPDDKSIYRRDHPCVCGEKFWRRDLKGRTAGSPLRMRGKEITKLFLDRFIRITPAYAGKSVIQNSWNNPSEDHPCVCGEKETVNPRISKYLGSPLRMRGKVLTENLHLPLDRITPAYAGKSWYTPIAVRDVEDHPCVCGEKLGACGRKWSRIGSPLRMRGKVLFRNDIN